MKNNIKRDSFSQHGPLSNSVNKRFSNKPSASTKRKKTVPDNPSVPTTNHSRKKQIFNQTKRDCERQTFTHESTSSKNDVWFDGVSPALIAASREDQSATTKTLVKASSFSGPTRRIAMDCEFVGVGYQGKDNALARVSIVNQFGHVLLDSLVRPNERVTDYRTQYSGIRPRDLRPDSRARPFKAVHREVAKLCKGRILIGHSIQNDLKVLMLSHPRRDIRDTSRYRPFRALFSGRTPSLRALTEKVLGVQVQTGEHDSIEDARAAMRLYNSVKRIWESRKKSKLPVLLGAGDTKQLNTQPDTKSSKLDILSEYESGLEPIEPAATSTKQSLTPKGWKSKPWDGTRNRRCSKRRERFLQKRRKVSRRNGLQSAVM